jgi:hypothetical protein
LILLIERLPESGSRGPACDPIGAEFGALGLTEREPMPLPDDEPPDEEPPGKPVEEPFDDPELLITPELFP